jgi:hypothetical protein
VIKKKLFSPKQLAKWRFGEKTARLSKNKIATNGFKRNANFGQKMTLRCCDHKVDPGVTRCFC